LSRAAAAINRVLVVVESDAMKQVARDIEQVAESDAPTVVEGERGTGREMIARVIHFAGARSRAPFVSVEAAAAPSPLFDDGIDNPVSGPLRDAAGGTLLIKNLCALGVSGQQRIAQVLRGGVGDVRIMGACDSDLDAAVEAGVFDPEVYEALVPNRICLPPLRDRAADIPPLAVHFVREYAQQIGRGRISLSTRAFERLVRYPWPGNVAELKDLARRLVIRCKASRIEAGDVDAVLPVVAERIPIENMSLEEMVRAKLRAFLRRVEGYPLEGFYDDVQERVERPLFELIMEHTGGNQLRAAEILGLNRNTLRRKLSDYGIRARTIRATSRKKVSAVRAAKTARADRSSGDS
jgi:two-component system nitrogen regulation response regulator GlnG